MTDFQDLSAVAIVSALKCESCKNWHRHIEQPPDLSQPRQGDCRALPPQLLPIIRMDRQGVGQPVGGVAVYPALPGTTDACGLFQRVEA